MLEITKLSWSKARLTLRQSEPSVSPCPSHGHTEHLPPPCAGPGRAPAYPGQKPPREGAATSEPSAGDSPELGWSHLIDLIGCRVTAAAPLLTGNRHCRCVPSCMSPRPSSPSEAAGQLENTSYFINLQPPPRQAIISSSPNDSSLGGFLYGTSPTPDVPQFSSSKRSPGRWVGTDLLRSIE